MADSFRNAMINRALGDIKNNLQFLVEANVITAAQHDTVSSQLPVSAENSSRALPAVPTQQLSQMNIKSEPTPPPEKKASNVGYYADTNGHNAPPPAYPSVPATPAGPPVLAYASAMYQYNAQDAGDLALMPNDKVVVTEYMNNEWWKGRNERTGMEGIFPASYVRKEEKSIVPAGVPSAPAPSNYGNMPLDVSNGAQGSQEPSKMEQNGKRFGKKLGNAAIFGAGATIGGKIVNGIF
ncbi:protein that induces appearance of [PIN+] prion when overproduced [Neocucurbitaria cava]|uniref:Protein that induces appearance of [PIN+] prion when overproduced n=1 Tax=Neocucurbitaria cava TaxID=798079 RepID=A0A9W9CN22_9PLEO|nr:protein that induces appearance of [PIN+] prion when overproduced [Neocucurbitaria cava]